MSDSTDSLAWRPQADDFGYLTGFGIGTTATQLLFNGQGSVSPVAADFLAIRFKNAILTNRSGAPLELTIQGFSVVAGLPTPIPILPINIAASASVVLDESQFAGLIPAGYGVEAFTSAGSADVSLLVYQEKG